jgi:hypothetical protein
MIAMARPWIEFIQSQALAWTPHDLWGVAPGVEAKILSRDDETDAASVLVRFPAGWKGPSGPRSFAMDEEFLVLDGALEINGEHFGHLNYAHWPQGIVTSGRASPHGAVALWFCSARPAPLASAGVVDERRLVRRLDAYDVPYAGNFHPEFPPGAGRKMLYKDPDTQEQSWLLATMAIRWAQRSEVHPVVEEMYLLAGESHGDRGVMRPGAYFWRPPGIPHGPYGTLTGNLYFFRTKGGGLTTTYVDAPKTFKWNPDYQPMVPEELAGIVRETPSGTQCW